MPDMEDRVDRIVERLLRGGRLKASAREAAEREAVMAAARLAGARDAHPRMSPAFRRRLAATVRGEARPITRRTALAGAAGLAAGGLGAALAARLAAPSAPASRTGPAGGLMQPAHGWVRVASLAELPAGRPVKVVAGDVTAYLFRSAQNVRAVSAICSDMPCSLDWRQDSGRLYCPCHRALFSAEGSSLSQTYSVPPLPSYAVKVEAGDVYLLAP
jgi:nitrite reductase/ring-hydroxylating ferredoxin subunit